MTVNFTNMDNETYHRVMYEANSELIDAYYRKQVESDKNNLELLYFAGDDSNYVPSDHQKR